MTEIMLALDSFSFSVDTATYNELTRTFSWNWASQGRTNNVDLLQFGGSSSPKISLKGQIATSFKNAGTQQIQTLINMANKGKPYSLHSAHGDVMGRWCIQQIQETNSHFGARGVPRFQEFTMDLIYYDEDKTPAASKHSART
ncbi:phage tail protein [Celerinatantimonas sp. YJH-8]|uniref:phage tail protein n=1 Tax=Celerinatantimonas sp. YJH-8 TaxID=3228714 RepID=UPI0038C03E5A